MFSTHVIYLCCVLVNYFLCFYYVYVYRVEFPFLVLLASGGHCLLAIARDIDDFLLLGSSQDIAPGEAYDKVFRMYSAVFYKLEDTLQSPK